MKLTILGTGHAGTLNCYNTCFILQDQDRYFLVDGGGGNTLLSRLKQIDVPLSDIHQIFVTHRHMDHLTGILWIIRRMLRKRKQGKSEPEVIIYGHDEIIHTLTILIQELFPEKAELLGENLALQEVHDGETLDIIGHPVTFFDIRSDKAKQYGFMMGLENDQKLVCCGDEPYNESELFYAKDADWLLHEAFCLYSEAEKHKPYEKHHSTVRDACENADRLGVKNLILYHTEETHLSDRKTLYTEEGKQYFQGSLYVPDDMESFEI